MPIEAKPREEWVVLLNRFGAIEPRDESLADFDTVEQAEEERPKRDKRWPDLAPFEVAVLVKRQSKEEEHEEDVRASRGARRVATANTDKELGPKPRRFKRATGGNDANH